MVIMFNYLKNCQIVIQHTIPLYLTIGNVCGYQVLLANTYYYLSFKIAILVSISSILFFYLFDIQIFAVYFILM